MNFEKTQTIDQFALKLHFLEISFNKKKKKKWGYSVATIKIVFENCSALTKSFLLLSKSFALLLSTQKVFCFTTSNLQKKKGKNMLSEHFEAFRYCLQLSFTYLFQKGCYQKTPIRLHFLQTRNLFQTRHAQKKRWRNNRAHFESF